MLSLKSAIQAPNGVETNIARPERLPCPTGQVFRRRTAAILCAAILFGAFPVMAQRQMEPLGRGVVAVRSSSSQVYIGWRLLATDPPGIAFNLFRSAAGAAGVKLNSQPITNTTDYLDSGANLSVSNAYFVVPLLNGVSQAPSASFGLPANSPTRQYINLPLQPPAPDGLSYDVKFSWVGDFDSNGEYDFLVDRLCTTAGQHQYLQAYLQNGLFLWQVDMGPLSVDTSNSYEPAAAAISVGDKDNVTVYDLDGDGRAEVIVRAANGTVLPGGVTVTTNNSTSQFLCILDGRTGAERARALIPNPYFADGPLNCHAGIAYLDGIQPSIIFAGENRVGSGSFQRLMIAWDFRNGKLTQRWVYQTPAGQNDEEGHQLRIADVNHDGKDDIVRIGSVVSDNNGVPVALYSTELRHGDRYHVSDLDPDRPGLEMFAIQQNNPTLLATSLQDLQTGVLFKKWYAGSVTDVGRGVTLDMDPGYRGLEVYSTQPGTFDCKGNQIWPSNLWPPEAIWWDADLLRELEDGAGSGGLSPVINKYSPSTHSAGRLYTIYSEDGGCHQAYGARAAFWGDILGDWREELVLVANDFNAIRIYTTKIPATNRIYCLMQNPQYRAQSTYRGYYQAGYVDYYLGHDMPSIPVPPLSNAELVWRGGGPNVWDAGTTKAWLTNNLWISNTTTLPFASGKSVLFDLSGSNNTAVSLSGTLTPSAVTVWSPKDYTFSGSGALSGAMPLTKAGAGKLILSGTNSYTGPTLIGEGSFFVNGQLPNSPVTVRGGVWLDGRLAGSGTVGSPVRIEEGGGVSPGQGLQSAGTLTISNNLTLAGRTLNDFDLSDDPSGTAKTNDLLIVTGNLTLIGTNTINIRKLNSALQPGGVYPIIRYGGSLSGTMGNLVLAGLPGVPAALSNAPGQIVLVLKSYRAPATIQWTGGLAGNTWDLLTTSNWLNGISRDQFAPGDTVRFDSLGTSNLTVNLAGDLTCSGMVVDSTANYTLAGPGRIIGSAGLTKTNAGTLTVNAMNSTFTGKTIVAGGTLVIPKLDAIGSSSPLGNPPGGATNLVLSGGATLRITGESYTDRGLTLHSGLNSIEVQNGADQVTIAGQLTGTGGLKKTGPGTLALTTVNDFSGGTLVVEGVISLGGDAANELGFGTGPVRMEGGTITMFDNSGSYNSASWNLLVPAGASATLNADSRIDLYGALAGAGTLNFRIPYVRTTLYGNWSAFTGILNITTDADGGDFRISNAYGYPNATVNLTDLVTAYHTSSGAGVAIGALSGSSGSRLSGGVAWTVGSKNVDTSFAGTISSGSITKIGSGTWTLTGSNYYAGTTTVSGGALVINGNHSSATGNVLVNAFSTLAGTGNIGGNTTIQSGGQLAPGSNGIGLLTLTSNLVLAGGSTTRLELNAASASADRINVGRSVTLGGVLVVTNLGGTLSDGARFTLFNAETFTGVFASVRLPQLESGLAWDARQLNSSGVLAVVRLSTPKFSSVSLSGNEFVFGASGGTPGWSYYVLSTTNAELPLANWGIISTNQFDASGNAAYSIPFNLTQPRRFFRLQVPQLAP